VAGNVVCEPNYYLYRQQSKIVKSKGYGDFLQKIKTVLDVLSNTIINKPRNIAVNRTIVDIASKLFTGNAEKKWLLQGWKVPIRK
jgi:hypothetical protein